MNNNYYENIEINNHDALYTIIKIVLLLLTLQITRIVLKIGRASCRERV